MASWLSAGSVDDGTVVRRASAAHTNLKFDAPDLFAPSKLESIFNNNKEDEDLLADATNESLSFIPSPFKATRYNSIRADPILKSTDEELLADATNESLSFIPSPVKYTRGSSTQANSARVNSIRADTNLKSKDEEADATNESLSFIPSPVKYNRGNSARANSARVESIQVNNTPKRGDEEMLPDGSNEWLSTLPSDLSQGTSIAIQPKNRQSLGTGDYLSEASRVMTYLRQGQVAQMSPAADMEQMSDLTPLTAEVAQMPATADMSHMSDPTPLTAEVAQMPLTAKLQQMSDLTPLAAKDTTVIRSPSKHVDWVEYALQQPDQATYATPKYSILDLTPLPDFTAHEDDPQHPERSFVDERAHERALRQAHGSLALSRDALIQAITDAKPDELYWEEITELDLKAKGLGSLHGLDELCPNLVVLDVSENSLTHLNGIPPGVRTLDVSRNLLSDMVCWSGLKNLHCLDISGNKHITNLDGLGELVHLRTLRAAACSINNIDGIKILDGLLDLQLQLNKLQTVDFGRTNFAQLETLDMSTNKLGSVTNLSKLVSLQDLHLSQNMLTEIVPVGRRGPCCLQTLEADQNQIEFFNLKQYPALRYAMLDDNKLTRVHGLGKTPYFEELSIRNQDASSDLVNRILSTPNDCNTLMLSGNPLPNGRLELPELPQHSLRALELTECGINELGKGFGRKFPNLRLLNLNYNHIQELGDLQGMHKIKRLELIRNRITRMRRTCLLLARLPTLAVLDIRDNPLTMAFHPAKGEDEEADAKWLRSCDENTKMRRRLTEMLLAEHCKQLKQVNGLGFDRATVLRREEVWERCEERGALRGQ